MKKYVLPFLYSLAIFLGGCLFSSILYYFNIINDGLNKIFLYVIGIFGIFIGSFKFAKELKYKGIISGLIYYLIWFVIMIFLSIIIFKINFSFKTIIYYLTLLIFSILGAILGKNLKEENSD